MLPVGELPPVHRTRPLTSSRKAVRSLLRAKQARKWKVDITTRPGGSAPKCRDIWRPRIQIADCHGKERNLAAAPARGAVWDSHRTRRRVDCGLRTRP